MAMIWSSRERNRSCSPLSRRSRGRIQPSVAQNRSQQRVRVFDSTKSPNRNLQKNWLKHCEFRQNEVPDFAPFLLKNREVLEIFHSQLKFQHPSRRLGTGKVSGFALILLGAHKPSKPMKNGSIPFELVPGNSDRRHDPHFSKATVRMVCKSPKRGKSRGGMIIRFPRGGESESLWVCRHPKISMAYQTPI